MMMQHETLVTKHYGSKTRHNVHASMFAFDLQDKLMLDNLVL